MRKTSFLFGLFICTVVLAGFPAGALAMSAEDNLNTVVEQQISELDLSAMEEFIDRLDADVSEYLPDLSLSGLWDQLIHGRVDLSFTDIIQGLAKYLFGELLANSSLLGQLIILAVICAVLKSLQTAFEKQSISKLAHMVTYLVLITLGLASFTVAVNIGREAIDGMVDFVHAAIPPLLTLMAASGSLTTTAFLHPVVFTTVTVMATLIKNVVFPLIYLAVVLSIVSHISDRFPITRLAGLFKQISMGALGLVLTVFIGVLGIQGVAGAVTDTLTLRTAKFMTGNFVPVVGKALADSLEAMVSTSIFLRNMVGLVGVIIIVVLTIFPAVKILALIAVYKLASVLVQPFGETEISEALESMSNNLGLIFASVAAVGLVFFIAIAVIVGMGNVSAMMR